MTWADQRSHAIVPVVFSDEQLQELDRAIASMSGSPGTVRDWDARIVVDPSRKDNRVRAIDPAAYPWVYRRVAEVTNDTNARCFGFDLIGIKAIHILEYGLDQHYGWHVDSGVDAFTWRKLTLSVQLSPPDSYEGGALELHFGPVTVAAPRTRGTGLYFPTWVLHRVAPVTAGVRRCLIASVLGPAFR